MPQPIKKKIYDTHGDIIKEPPTLTLLIDGNSLLFNCFADKKTNSDGVHYGAIYQFLLQIRMQLTQRQFHKIVCVFDSHDSGLLRYQIYKPYKQNRGKDYESHGVSEYMQAFNENLKRMQKAIFKPKEKVSPQEAFIDENFDRERDVLCEMFNEVCIRWHMDEIVEGDDLIAYYCLHKRENERILIISADMDLTQLLSDEVMIYNQKLKKYISNKNFKQYFGYDYRNTLVKKIFCGDTSDNIGNIKGLSEAKLFEIMPEIKDRGVTVEEVKQRAQMLNEERVKEKKKPFKVYENIIEGVATKDYDGDFYEINEKLVNLHKPILTDEAKEEADGLIEAPLDMEDRNIANLVGIIEREKVEELMGDTRFASFFAPFKRIIGIEDDFYRKSLSE